MFGRMVRQDALPIEATCNELRRHLSAFLEQVASGHKTVIVHCGSGKDIALLPAQELRSLTETAHLLQSPTNTKRLLKALQRAKRQVAIRKPSPKP